MPDARSKMVRCGPRLGAVDRCSARRERTRQGPPRLYFRTLIRREYYDHDAPTRGVAIDPNEFVRAFIDSNFPEAVA